MEPFDSQRDPRRDDRGGLRSPSMNALVPGMILVGVGVLFLLGNLHIVHAAEWIAYWPVIPIALGLVQLVDSDTTVRRIVGGVMMAVFGLILADNLGYISFRVEDLWPLILIGIGGMMLWTRLTGQPVPGWNRRFQVRNWAADRFRTSTSFSGNVVHEYAVFGGTRRVVTDPDFQGGRVACVFGGLTLDLTGAGMVGNTAVLDISTVYGGATVLIPANWNLEVRAAGIFGGMVDRTVHPPNTPDMKHLIIRGAAVFGGVTFKN